MKTLLFALIFFISFFSLKSQNNEIINDLEKSKGFYNSNLDSARFYANLALKKADILHSNTLQGQAYSNLGVTFWYLAKYDSARLQFENAIPYFEKENDSLRLAKTHGNIGLLFKNAGDYKNALT